VVRPLPAEALVDWVKDIAIRKRSVVRAVRPGRDETRCLSAESDNYFVCNFQDARYIILLLILYQYCGVSCKKNKYFFLKTCKTVIPLVSLSVS